MKKLLVAVFGLAFGVAQAEDNVLWVDAANYKESCETHEDYEQAGFDGSSAEKAYGTIQAAIDAAESGWTIKVKPGTYDKGGRATTEADDCVARVLITKPLAIISTGSAADTFIVGAADPDETAQSTYKGCGPNAVRCVRFEQAAGGQSNPAVLKGFTLRDGHCADQRNGTDKGDGKGVWGQDVLAGQPGGVAGSGAAYGYFYVADCVIENCYGVRAGSARHGRYVRCRFGTCNGAAGNDLGRDIYCISCLFAHATSTAHSSHFVNCTFADLTSCPFITNSGSSEIYNTLAAHVSTTKDITTATEGVSRNSALPVTGINADEKDCVYHLGYPLFAPLRGDYCVRAGSPAATVGSAEVLADRIAKWFNTAPAIVEIRKAYDGVEYPAEGAMPAGCYVKTKSAAGGAALFLAASVVCDGWMSFASTDAQYAFSEKPRDIIRVTPPEDAWYFGYKRADAQGGFQYPEMDESFVQHLPPEGIVVTNEIVRVAQHLWVDPTNGVDEEDAGTEENPCKTLAYVMGKVLDATHTLIHAAAGDYNEGVMESTLAAPRNFGRTRVNLERKLVRLKGAGRGLSFITGEPDPDTDPSELDRRGPNAVRCVVLDGTDSIRTCVQGFTIRDGYANAGEEDVATKKGGLVYAPNKHENNQVVDCELIGGQAFRSGQVQYAICTRCIFHGWRLYTVGHAIRQGGLRSCLVYDEAFGGGGNIDSVQIYQSTIVHTNTTGQTHTGSTVTLDSSIAYMPNLKSTVSHANAISSVFYTLAPGSFAFVDADKVKIADSIACKVDADFVDVPGADFRLRTTSEIFTKQYDVSPDYWKMPATDVYGVPFNFASGKSVPGAIATPAQVSVVNQPPFGSFESGSSGTNALAKGESVTVTFSGVENRNAEALLVGGVPVEGFSHTYTYDGEAFAADGSVVRPAEFTVQFSTNWYVNVAAAAGGNGFSPETAWNSLMRIKDTGWVLSGDCVHVAQGDYEETGYEDASKGNSCVWIPEGVTVVADEGPDVTRILGKKGTGTNGRGAGAMRCVRAETGATIRNFTLANGYTTGAANDDNALNSGGGILFAAASTAGGTAVGCVITNCVAGRGGAAHYGTLVNCKVLDCWGTACNSSGSHSLLVGCYVDGCGQNQWCRNAAGVYRCTFGPNTGDNKNGADPFEGCTYVDNCVIMRYASVTEARAKLFHNCLVLDGAAWTDAMKALAPDCKWFSDYASMGVDAAGHPLAKTAEPVDNGTALQTPTYDALLAGLDAGGNQRAYNGTIDIGCYEYDWRGVYQTDLGTCATVETADPQVVETEEGKVLVKDGAIAIRFTDESLRAKYQVPFEVTGTGTLTLKAGDEIVGTYTAADGAQTLTYKNRIYGNDLAFSYAPGANDAGGALLDVQSGGVSGAVLIVR